jgi:uncharacterized protein DUF4157
MRTFIPAERRSVTLRSAAILPGGRGQRSLSAGRPASTAPLPGKLRAGAEALSGISLANVRVHNDSSEPARLGALAFAFGSEIHLAPGQERHLPHEAWHAVQQMQGRAPSAPQMQGGGPAKQPELESEADEMGRQADKVVPLTGDASDCAAALISADGTPLGVVFARRMDLFEGLPAGTRAKCADNSFFAEEVRKAMERVLKEQYGWKYKKVGNGQYRIGTLTMWVGGKAQAQDYNGMGAPEATLLAALKVAVQTVAPGYLSSKK